MQFEEGTSSIAVLTLLWKKEYEIVS